MWASRKNLRRWYRAQARRRLRLHVHLVFLQPAAVTSGTQPSEHQHVSAANDVTAESEAEPIKETLWNIWTVLQRTVLLWRTLTLGPGRRASRAAGLTVGLRATSKAASGFVLLPFQTKPRWKMSAHRPAFIWRFEEPSCWDRPELRKRRANWKLILVWVPEMSAAPVIPASPLQLLSTIITFSGLRCRSGPFAGWFWEFSFLIG